jgi:hypothetical protein
MFRYPVPVDDSVYVIEMSAGSEPVAVAGGNDVVEFWAEFCEDCPTVSRQFFVVGTGHPIPAGAKYAGTAPRTALGLVWHLYEVAVGVVR